jgi:hypothetical protein
MVAPVVVVAAQVAKRKLIRRVVRVLLLAAPFLIAGLACIGLLLVMLFTSGQVNNSAVQGGDGCVSVVPASQTMAGLDREQLVNAQTIVAVGRQANVPAYGWVVAVATALQESGLRNLDHGDRDSLGLFQQRAGWGSASLRMDVAAAARMFYAGGRNAARGLLQIPGWESMPLAWRRRRFSAAPSRMRTRNGRGSPSRWLPTRACCRPYAQVVPGLSAMARKGLMSLLPR